MSRELSYTNIETEWSKDLSLKDNFPMPGRRQLHIALAAAVLGIMLAIVLGYFVFNAQGTSKEGAKPASVHNSK